MGQLGEQLRQARENQGLSLAQAAVETRILQQSLAALEEGAYHRLPGDVVTRGFIRNYAQYLGLSPEELIELYRRERGSTDKIRVVPTTSMVRGRAYVVPSFLGVFFVTIALVGLTYVALNAAGRISPREASVPPATTQIVATATNLPTAEPVPTVVFNPSATLPTPTLPAVAGIAITPLPSATPEAPIVVEVRIDAGADRSWLRIQVDEVTAYERIMNPGEREIFQARRQVYIRAGNPTVVQVSVNGLQQGTIGVAPGRPVDWYWPPR